MAFSITLIVEVSTDCDNFEPLEMGGIGKSSRELEAYTFAWLPCLFIKRFMLSLDSGWDSGYGDSILLRSWCSLSTLACLISPATCLERLYKDRTLLKWFCFLILSRFQCLWMTLTLCVLATLRSLYFLPCLRNHSSHSSACQFSGGSRESCGFS